MSLTLHSHPLASFCQKVLVALYENNTPHEAVLVRLELAESRDAFKALWPLAKMPVLQDSARGVVLPETSIIIEYLARHYPGRTDLLPVDFDIALDVRLMDRCFDLYVSEPMQKIVDDILRPADGKDPVGVSRARDLLRTAYGWLDMRLGEAWAAGPGFTLADCSAAPALFYSEKLEPFAGYANLTAYWHRLRARPSVARVFEEAGPYMHLFPG